MPKNNSSIDQDSDIGEYVRKAERDFTAGTTQMSKYVDFAPYEDINKIYAYLDSKHTSGPTDSLGRDKPFFNIVLAARNIWFRATDIDRSNIKIRATKSADDIGAFMATVQLQDWMRRENFGTFLNAWGINSAGFNESVLKFVEQDGRLIPSVVPWSRIICDVIDFDSNPKVEILEMTEAQLRKNKAYDQELVEELCDARKAREMTDGQRKDNRNNYIKLYEVHGEFPKSMLTGNEDDEDEYTQQMHVITFLATKDGGKFDDYTLYKGRESKDPYMLAALLPEIDGSIAFRGSVKGLFDAQWMQNHSIKAIKDQLDLASKLIYQTSDGTFVGQNVLQSIENGDILIHKPNEPITVVAHNISDIVSLQNFQASWKQLGNEINGISDAMLGVAPKSGTAWRQTQAVLNENYSLFEVMTENRGLSITKALREYIIPFLKKKMDNTKEASMIMKAHDIDKLDARYIKNSSIQKSNKALKEMLLSGQSVTPEDQQQMTQENAQQTQEGLQEQGAQRFFLPSEISSKTWKELFKDLEWEVEVDVTNENLDKDALTTLNQLLTVVTDPVKAQGLATPQGRMVFNKILELTGAVSTIELAGLPTIQAPQAQNKVSESISFKDLPFEGQQQMAQQAGIKITQPAPQQTPNGGSPVANQLTQ